MTRCRRIWRRSRIFCLVFALATASFAAAGFRDLLCQIADAVFIAEPMHHIEPGGIDELEKTGRAAGGGFWHRRGSRFRAALAPSAGRNQRRSPRSPGGCCAEPWDRPRVIALERDYSGRSSPNARRLWLTGRKAEDAESVGKRPCQQSDRCERGTIRDTCFSQGKRLSLAGRGGRLARRPTATGPAGPAPERRSRG